MKGKPEEKLQHQEWVKLHSARIIGDFRVESFKIEKPDEPLGRVFERCRERDKAVIAELEGCIRDLQDETEKLRARLSAGIGVC